MSGGLMLEDNAHDDGYGGPSTGRVSGRKRKSIWRYLVQRGVCDDEAELLCDAYEVLHCTQTERGRERGRRKASLHWWNLTLCVGGKCASQEGAEEYVCALAYWLSAMFERYRALKDVTEVFKVSHPQTHQRGDRQTASPLPPCVSAV